MVYSIAGLLGGSALVGARPFRAPHHTVSAAGLVGGGPDGAPGRDLARAQRRAVPRRAARVPAPGAGDAAPAAGGPRRSPSCASRRGVTYPADFMLIAALNPCPCGHLGSAVRTCTCSPAAIAAYRVAAVGSAARSHRPARRGPGAAVPGAARTAEPGESSAAVRDAGRWRRASGSRRAAPRWNARLSSTRAAAGGAARRRRARAAGTRGRAAGPVGARHHPRAPRGAHHRRPRRAAPPIATAHLAEALQYRVLDQPNDLTNQRSDPCPA